MKQVDRLSLLLLATALLLVGALDWSFARASTPATPPTPAAFAAGSEASTAQSTGAAAMRRVEVHAAKLCVVDWLGRPIAARVGWLMDGRVRSAHCPTDGTAMPAHWEQLAIAPPNWLPIRVRPDELLVSSDGVARVRLPPPSWIAQVIVPADRHAELALRAKVAPDALREGWSALDAAVLGQGPVGSDPAIQPPAELVLDWQGGPLIAGGLPGTELHLVNAGRLLFRRADGHVLSQWTSAIPDHAARIELCAPPSLRITAVLVDGLPPADPRLRVEQFDLRGNGIGSREVAARLGVTETFALRGGARRADVRLLARAGTAEPWVVAAARIVLAGGDEHLRLEIGRDRCEVRVQDQHGAPIADAALADWNDLLGISDERGAVVLSSMLCGAIDVVADGYDCEQVQLSALRRRPVIVLKPATKLVIDGRAAARALPGCRLEIRGDFLPPCQSRLAGGWWSQWSSRSPSAGEGVAIEASGPDDGREHLRFASRGATCAQQFELEAGGEFELQSIMRPDSQVSLTLLDFAGVPTEVSSTLRWVRGQSTRVEMPVPAAKRFAGKVVSRLDGRPLSSAKASFHGSWFLPGEISLTTPEFSFFLAQDNAVTLEHPGYEARTWSTPEPDGIYRLGPARSPPPHDACRDR